jgi:CPA2 family monovalent cation:H+ antiporter-2
MIGLAVLLLAAAAGLGAAKALRIPALPLLLVAGVALSLLGALPSAAILEEALVLGLTVLVFVSGIELSPRRIRPQWRLVLRIGLAQFALLGAVGYGAARLLGFPATAAGYLAVAVAASSTLVVVRLLRERERMFEPAGRMLLGVLLLQDLLVILLIPVLMRAPSGAGAAALGLAGALALMALAGACLIWLTPLLVARLADDEEMLLLVTLALLFIFLALADVLRLPVVAGGFLAGVALSRFPLSGIVHGQLAPVADFFLAIFFTALGGILVVPTLPDLLRALALAATVVLVTPPLVIWLAERAGFSARPAIEAGLLLAQTSEFSLIIGMQALVLGQIVPRVFTVIALVTVLTMIATPFLSADAVTWRLMRVHPLRQEGRLAHRPEGHVLLLGCGENGMPLLETLTAAGHEVVVVDDDPAVIARLRGGDVPCVRGDGSDPEVLEAVGARDARAIVSTIRRPAENLVVLARAPGVPLLARAFNEEEAEEIAAHGGTPILYARSAADDFLQWLDQAEQAGGVATERRHRPRTL